MRESRLSAHPVIVQVDAYNKDHAIDRVCREWPAIDRADWEIIDEIDPENETIGAMGAKLYLHEVTNKHGLIN